MSDREPPRASLQSLVDALSVALGRPVLLDDPALVPLAYSRQWGDIDVVRSDSILGRGAPENVRRALERKGIATADGIVEIGPDEALGMTRRLCLPLRREGRLHGFIWLLDPRGSLSARELRSVLRAGDRVVELLTRPDRNPVADASELLAALTSQSGVERADAEAAAYARPLFARGPLALCVVRPRAGAFDAVALSASVGRRLSQGHALVGAIRGDAAIVVALTDPVLAPLPAGALARWVHEIADAEISVGQSAVAHRLAELPVAHRQASIAVRVAAARAAPDAHAAWSALGADRFVAQLPPEATSDVPSGLARLVREEPELADTLRAFLDAAGDVRAVAAALTLHRSGLYYRLRRIEEITGLDLSRGDDRLLAHVAIRLGAFGARGTEQMSR